MTTTARDTTPGDAGTPDGTPDGTASAGMKTERTGGVVRAGAVMAVATLVSRVTGFLAKALLLAALGFGAVNDAYTMANTLPNIVFELLIGGVLTSVAIPLLSRARSDPDGGQGYTQRLLTVAVLGLLVATALAIAAAPLLTRLYLSDDAGVGTQELADQLAYLLLPQIFFYGIAALFGAVLNSGERFGVPAWAPVVNNLVVIVVAVLMLTTVTGDGDLMELSREQYLLLGIGTTVGIVAQAAVMVPSLLRSGFRWRWRWGGDRRLLEAGQLMLWTVLYVVVSQVGYVVLTNVASQGVTGGVALFAFASLLFQLPYGIIGVSVLTAIMPRMSRHAAAGQIEAVKDDAALANRLSIVALTPVAAGLVVLATAVAVITASYGSVDWDDTLVLGSTLAALALGLVPLAVTLVQTRVFYAMKDARTPTILNAIMVAVRVPLLLLCVRLDDRFVVPGLALATAVSYLVGAVVGEVWLRARYGSMGTRRTLLTLAKMVLAGGLGAGAALLVGERLLRLEVDDLGDALVEMVVMGLVGLVVIAAAAVLLRVQELEPVRVRMAALVHRALPGRRRATPGPPPSSGTLTGGERPTGPGPDASPTDRQPVGQQPADDPRPDEQEQPEVTDHDHDRQRPAERTVAAAPVEAATPVRRHHRFEDVSADDADALADVPRLSRGATPGSPPGSPLPATQAPDGDAVTTALPLRGRHADPGSADLDTDPPTTALAAVGSGRDAGEPVEEAPTLLPGTMLGGRYRLTTLISADAAGNRFWRAQDTVLPREMAVTLLPDTTLTSATVTRTLRAGRLHHLGLPQTLDVGVDQGHCYVVGQWVDGATLTELLASGPLEPAVAVSVTGKVADAVAEAHRNGIALGAINPDLVRVNFDGQVRLSHVVAHASATPEHDIRAVGALLYLMTTGTWPLPDTRAPHDARTALPESTPVGAVLPPAPTRRGREIPAAEVVPGLPPALSRLADRALHPEEPDGIRAISAIAALLTSPETVPSRPRVATEVPGEPYEELNQADRRLVRERRVKLSIGLTVLLVFAALVVIAVASLSKQFMVAVQNTGGSEGLLLESSSSAAAAPVPTPETSAVAPPEAAASSAAAPAPVPVPIVGGTVYDPEGTPPSDYTAYVDRAFDGNPDTDWLTFVYFQQFPALKPGVGLTLQLEREVTPATVTITSPSPGTVVEVRSATGPSTPLAQTQVLGTATVADGPVTVTLTGAPRSAYLTVFVTQLDGSGNQWQSRISEVAVTGT